MSRYIINQGSILKDGAMSNCERRPRDNKAKGFTLIELLVVIAIVALLTALLMQRYIIRGLTFGAVKG